MQVMVELPDEIIEDIKAGYNCAEYADECYLAVQRGTVLPQPHGRLGDLDALQTEMEEAQRERVALDYNPVDAFSLAIYSYVCEAPTIIEAS